MHDMVVDAQRLFTVKDHHKPLDIGRRDPLASARLVTRKEDAGALEEAAIAAFAGWLVQCFRSQRARHSFIMPMALLRSTVAM